MMGPQTVGLSVMNKIALALICREYNKDERRKLKKGFNGHMHDFPKENSWQLKSQKDPCRLNMTGSEQVTFELFLKG